MQGGGWLQPASQQPENTLPPDLIPRLARFLDAYESGNVEFVGQAEASVHDQQQWHVGEALAFGVLEGDCNETSE